MSRRWDFKHGQVEVERAGPSTRYVLLKQMPSSDCSFFTTHTDANRTTNSLSRPTSPLVRSGTPWEDQLPLDNIAVGWYSLVFSVFFENMNFDLLKSITFDAKLDDDEKVKC